MFNNGSYRWEELLEIGLVIPLHKKVTRMQKETTLEFAYLLWVPGFWPELWPIDSGSDTRHLVKRAEASVQPMPDSE